MAGRLKRNDNRLSAGAIAVRLLYVTLLAAWIFAAGSLLGFDPKDPQ